MECNYKKLKIIQKNFEKIKSQKQKKLQAFL